ncbi:pitrilysin family protein [Pararhizobium sp. IMCC21322]|uniref:M16 family metallopeptidase n=1 Tax=Pararhizobium sp. IMCC21322 TaxID=3067903 RepID=UPI00274221CC|nr:pitrilysin family protein [Pararhizobium sp. IMCC21322]
MKLWPISRYFVVAIFAASFVSNSFAETFKIAPNAESSMLKNGLQIVVIPDNRAPVVTHMLWYKVGSADETPGKSGIAHFLEHLLFKGTKANPDGAFSKRIAEIGGQENAFTSSDYTGYFQRVAPTHLAEMMALEADRMRNLVLTDEVVLPEREVVLEERSSRIGNNPSSRLGEAIDASFYKNHPYRFPVIGWEHEIKQLNRKDAFAFYEKHYTPENAILIVAGDVVPQDVFDLAKATYGTISRNGDALPRLRPVEPPMETARTVTLANEQVKQPSVRRSFLTPSYSTAEGPEAAALSLLTEILGGGSTSRLYRELVLNGGPATAAGSWYQGQQLDSGRVSVYAVPNGSEKLEELIEKVQDIVENIKTGGVEQDELDKARNRMISDTVYAQDNQASLARIIGVGLTTGQTLEEIQNWPALLQSVTTDDVQNAAKQYLDAGRSITGYLLSADDENPS